VIDLHCHVLAGIDDGPARTEDSLALADAAAAGGTRLLVATPHVSWRYPNSADTIAERVDELNQRLAGEGSAIRVHTGAEIAATSAADIDPDELPCLGLAGGPWLLIEPAIAPIATGLDAVVLGLQGRGHGVVLAHPERCPAFHREPRVLGSLVRAGALTSITASSLTGRFGGRVRRFALDLAREGMVHNVASDAHDHLNRPPSIGPELARAGLSQLGEWLTVEVPAAILAGEKVPPRPAAASGGFGRLRLPWPRRRSTLGRALGSERQVAG
jgi:protein-tyrosine phosphatase